MTMCVFLGTFSAGTRIRISQNSILDVAKAHKIDRYRIFEGREASASLD